MNYNELSNGVGRVWALMFSRHGQNKALIPKLEYE